ncbi:hypothetical protein GALL_369210 [mine drainage metagenome]|uniref:Glycosyltransferase family 1 protein n=1 Tax=mine drainage metagenome TaxID=410659 RepID=A0A1J5QCH4_9ZZZZ
MQYNDTVNVAMLVDFPEGQASTIREYAIGIQTYSQHRVQILQVRSLKDHDLAQFDALILHYDLFSYPFETEAQLTSTMRGRISRFRGPKLAFAQDEYRACLQRIRTLNSMGITHLFTLAEESIWPIMYPKEFRHFGLSRVLTGYYSPSEMGISSPLAGQRDWLIGYRSRVTPSYLGELGEQKVRIAERVADFARAHNLPVNVSVRESDRIYGRAWLEFLRKSTICVGSESGSSSIDLSQEMQKSDENHDGNSNQLYPTRLANIIREAKVTKYSAISPRLFEYTEAGALMALLPGEYSGIIRPWEHYFPLDSDLGNLKNLIAFVQRQDEAQEMVLRAQQALLGEFLSYGELGRQVDSILGLASQDLKTVESIHMQVGHQHRSFRNTEIAPVPALPSRWYQLASKWITHPKIRATVIGYVRGIGKMKYTFRYFIDSYSRQNIKQVELLRRELATQGLFIRKWRFLFHVGLHRDLVLFLDECSQALELNLTLEVCRFEKRIWIEWRDVDRDIDTVLRRFPPVTPDVFEGSSGFYCSRGEFSSAKAIPLVSFAQMMDRDDSGNHYIAALLTQAASKVLSH